MRPASPLLGLPTLLALLWAPSAAAVQPVEGQPAGAEPTVMRTFDAEQQALGETLPAWKDCTQGEGQGWSMRFDGLARVPHRMWGPGLDLGPIQSADDAARAALWFAERHTTLLGTDAAELAVRKAGRDAHGRAWVDLDVLVDGTPLWRGYLTFRFEGDRLVMAGSAAWPTAPVVGARLLSGPAAIDAFRTRSRLAGLAHEDGTAEPMLLPRIESGKAVLRHVWVVRTRTAGTPPGQWVGFVDATTGQTLAFHNEVRFAGGTLTAEVDTVPYGGSARRVVALPHATVEGDTGDTLTDSAGAWAIAGDTGPFEVDLHGPRVSISDDLLGAVTPAIQSGDHLVTEADFSDDAGDRQAALSAFVFVHEVQDVMGQYAPDVSWIDAQADTTVNVGDSCNAWFDGTINFLRAGNGCRNTGRLADVVYHEWGHGFHYWSLEAGDFDGSLGEGAADVVSMLVTGSPDLAPGFYSNDSQPLRDLENNARYPEDFIQNEGAVHSNGLIFGGAMWELRQRLEADLGTPQGTDTFGHLFATALKAGPDIPGAYDEIVFADDDDGDLSNGTPHQCAIVEAFAAHGLGPASGEGLKAEISRFDSVAQGTDKDLVLTVPNPAPECLDVTPTGGRVFWRAGRTGSFTNTALQAGTDIRGVIPTADLSLGTIVEYWVEVDTADGATLRQPVSGPIRPHTFYVGDVLEVGCEDFEDGDGGYTSALLDGVDEEGADDWWWGEPNGDGGDPDHAASGDKVWGNDLGGVIDGQGYNGMYQDAKHNRLTSPTLSTGHYEGVFLRYNRWLQVEDGVFDKASVLADGEEIWSNWATSEENGRDHHLDDAWEPHVLDLGEAADDGKIVLAWDLVTDQGLGFGGWTVDDICLMAPATADNRLGIDDFVAERSGDATVTLSWTHPKHAPVQTVRVVRTRGAWPQDANDGKVVWEGSDVALDTPITVEDDVKRGDLYYAVYASDGEDWLSWTRPGLNAAAVDPKGGVPVDPNDPTVSAKGCSGCAGSGSAPTGLLAGLVGVLIGTRRRRATR